MAITKESSEQSPIALTLASSAWKFEKGLPYRVKIQAGDITRDAVIVAMSNNSVFLEIPREKRFRSNISDKQALIIKGFPLSGSQDGNGDSLIVPFDYGAQALKLLAECGIPQRTLPLQNSSKRRSNSSIMEKLLPSVEGSKLCYSRIYDAEHLRANPRQTVSALALQLTYGKHPASEGEANAPAGHYFKLVAKLRKNAKVLAANGECTVRKDQVWCGAECDGGGIYLDISGDVSTIMMKLDDRLRMSELCEQRSAPELTPATRGERFKLHKADPSSCDVPR
jgi:hypothetical protein